MAAYVVDKSNLAKYHSRVVKALNIYDILGDEERSAVCKEATILERETSNWWPYDTRDFENCAYKDDEKMRQLFHQLPIQVQRHENAKKRLRCKPILYPDSEQCATTKDIVGNIVVVPIQDPKGVFDDVQVPYIGSETANVLFKWGSRSAMFEPCDNRVSLFRKPVFDEILAAAVARSIFK
jgi:hypothetical protein